ncbi:MAG: hypothetical protein CMM07_01955 [Rhodopirellula sp.]|nr:hypothetical protein [Rhodopirellula sp.]
MLQSMLWACVKIENSVDFEVCVPDFPTRDLFDAEFRMPYEMSVVRRLSCRAERLNNLPFIGLLCVS